MLAMLFILLIMKFHKAAVTKSLNLSVFWFIYYMDSFSEIITLIQPDYHPEELPSCTKP